MKTETLPPKKKQNFNYASPLVLLVFRALRSHVSVLGHLISVETPVLSCFLQSSSSALHDMTRTLRGGVTDFAHS